MTDKEFRRLTRSQLIDIIYQLQIRQEELAADNERLSKELEDKRLRFSKVGNIAEAALEIHNVMQSVQDAADHYMEEVRIRANDDYQQILREANEKATEILAKAQQEAVEIVEKPKESAPIKTQLWRPFLKRFSKNMERPSKHR